MNDVETAKSKCEMNKHWFEHHIEQDKRTRLLAFLAKINKYFLCNYIYVGKCIINKLECRS